MRSHPLLFLLLLFCMVAVVVMSAPAAVVDNDESIDTGMRRVCDCCIAGGHLAVATTPDRAHQDDTLMTCHCCILGTSHGVVDLRNRRSHNCTLPGHTGRSSIVFPTAHWQLE